MKDVLRNTAGITFQAAEGGEEDIRLRGFSLAGTGDIFLDGMRDPAFYDRDTFNNDRIEVLRGSASMLFGRGSTGGAVNQVSKVPRLVTGHEVTTTIGSHDYGRVTGDFNFQTGEDAALRLNAMANKADNNGCGQQHRQERPGRGLPIRHRNCQRISCEPLLPEQRQRHQLRPALDQAARQRHHRVQHHHRQPGTDGLLRHGQRLQRRPRQDGGVRPHPPLWRRKRTHDQGAQGQFRARPARRHHAVRQRATTDLTNFGPGTVFNRGTQSEDPGRRHPACAVRPQHQVQCTGRQARIAHRRGLCP